MAVSMACCNGNSVRFLLSLGIAAALPSVSYFPICFLALCHSLHPLYIVSMTAIGIRVKLS